MFSSIVTSNVSKMDWWRQKWVTFLLFWKASSWWSGWCHCFSYPQALLPFSGLSWWLYPTNGSYLYHLKLDDYPTYPAPSYHCQPGTINKNLWCVRAALELAGWKVLICAEVSQYWLLPQNCNKQSVESVSRDEHLLWAGLPSVCKRWISDLCGSR